MALIIGLSLSAFLYLGFDLIAGIFSSGKTQLFIRNLGLHARYLSIQKGLVDFSDLWYLLAITILFFILTDLLSGAKIKSPIPIIETAIFVLLISGSFWLDIRMDCTNDKRYTLSEPSKNILRQVESPIEMELYLDGKMNAGFTRLQKEIRNTIDNFNRITPQKIKIKTTDPQACEGMVDALDKQNIRGVSINEKDPDGKRFQQILFPWLKIKYKNSETMVYLLADQQGRSSEENLNASIESLEYNIVHGIQLVISGKNRKIVFIEGHGELEEPLLKDITDRLSSSFQIDRGMMSNKLNQLDDYELVIVAGPQLPYTEEEKFILDQYLMRGGRILWLINGVQLQSPESLAEIGKTISRVNEVNLEDLLFKYGVRINPILIQDTQCMYIPVYNDASKISSSVRYTLKPWYYAPLLVPNRDNPVTKDLPLIKSEFTSSLSFTDDKNPDIKKQVLLTSSAHSHPIQVPELISLQETEKEPDNHYFNQSYLPVAALLEGKFNSIFANRIPPTSIDMEDRKFLASGQHTKMIIIASEEVIRNEAETGYAPMGYDRYSGTTYGNAGFIMNAVSYLTDDTELINLRNKTFRTDLLDKLKIRENKINLMFWNVVFPPGIILLFFFLFYRRR
jgi:ABC-2 type transport system permease protein